MATVQIGVSDEAKKVIAQYAEEKGCTIGEAVDKMIRTWAGRMSAIRKYSEEHAPAKKAPKAKAEKKAPKKAAKAKGPIARKTKAAKKEATATA